MDGFHGTNGVEKKDDGMTLLKHMFERVGTRGRALMGGVAVAALSFLPFNQVNGQDYASAESSPNTETPSAQNTGHRSETKPVGGYATLTNPLIMYDDITNALDVSLYRDGMWEKGKEKDPYYVGVYMVVDEDCAVTADELIPGVKSYFDYYGLPVKFVKQSNPAPGKMASARIYVNGVSYDGNMSNGNLTFVELRDNHEQIFAKLKRMYKEANAPSTSIVLEPR